MSREDPRVEIIIVGERECLWNVVFVNGVEIPHRQRASSITEAEHMQFHMRMIVADAYKLGYQNGIADCRRAVREAIGAIGETK